jgi:type I restriction enzyme R subunit
MSKTIVFCDDQPHAERMRQEMVKLIPEAASNRRYVVRITGDDNEGKAQLSYFIDNDEPFPVIATTSRLLATGVDAKTCKLIVLDQNIHSMTQFKQIIGRGTRIREDYGKLYFTIMDFKGATRLFQDKNFDGEPVMVYEPKPNEPIVPPDYDSREGTSVNEEPAAYGADEISGDDSDTGGNDGSNTGGRIRYVLDDVDVGPGVERASYLDEHGRLITEEYRVYLKDDIQKTLRQQFTSLDDFLRRWNDAERKQAIVDELHEHGIPLSILSQAVPNGDELDVFDLVAHIAFDAKPLTRKERAEKVKKRNYFAKYGDQARAVLEALLEKYADHGITDIEDAAILELPPFNTLGTKTQIRRGIFGSNEAYSKAITELETALYDHLAA